MIVKSDQDRVRALLTEAITVLCKKRLSFKSQLSVEGLIGITLDSDDIFLVSLKELILKGEEGEEPVEKQMSIPVTSTKVRSGRQRKSTPRHLSVVSPPIHYHVDYPEVEEEEEEECTWQLQDGTDIDDLSPVTHLQLAEQHVQGYADQDPNGVLENGTDAPLNLSSYSSHSRPVPSRAGLMQEEKPHRDITPQKRKRYDSGDTDSQCSSVVSGSAKRPSSNVSNVSSLSPARTTPTLELVAIKQEPKTEPPFNNNLFDPTLNGLLCVQQQTQDKAPTALSKGFGGGVMKDTGNILAGRTNLIESAIWQRLASPITPIQLSSPILPSQANFVCPKCGRRMQHLGGWTRHVERCGTPRFCNVCGKQFKTSNSLRVHRFHYHRPAQAKGSKATSSGSHASGRAPVSSVKDKAELAGGKEGTKLENGDLQQMSHDPQPVLKAPLYSITGKLKKENKPTEKMPIKESTNTPTAEKISIKENGNNNSPDHLVLDLEKKHMIKKLEAKILSKVTVDTADRDSIDKLDHSYADVSASDSYLDHSDGYHSFHTDSTDQENIEVYSVDSDDDVKTEDFIDRSQEPGKAVSYKCKLCDRVYSNKWNCRRHIQYTHMNKTGFTCEICHNKYRDRSDYQEHMTVIHQGPGGYKCEFCDKILMSKRSLKEHVSLHTGQYRYHCIECSRGFNRLNDYQLHMTKDHGARMATVSSAEMAQILESSQKVMVSEAM